MVLCDSHCLDLAVYDMADNQGFLLISLVKLGNILYNYVTKGSNDIGVETECSDFWGKVGKGWMFIEGW